MFSEAANNEGESGHPQDGGDAGDKNGRVSCCLLFDRRRVLLAALAKPLDHFADGKDALAPITDVVRNRFELAALDLACCRYGGR
ncbi:hypothetical protein [Sinorhizobium meliloti]|uniref:hypothetical protein n=1 Tax=Rhizobium meliloti TaxID=382 RepID=UPI0013E3098C|nr:hypothetical protein [Sinorhizobium meliloti]